MKMSEHTVVDRLELRDDVQTNVREFVLEHLEEHGKEMRNGLVLSEDGRETTDLCAERSANVLRLIGDQLLDARHDLVKQCLALEKCAEAGNLPSNRAADLRLCVLEKLDESWYKVAVDNFLIDSLCDLLESIRDHVTHPPALVLEQAAQSRK
jgi:hypothetical protein